METLIRHSGVAVPLRRPGVDTDQIIPAEFLKGISRDGYEDALFANWRANREFVLNQERYQGASILVAGRDFGIGSSREQAVWALQNYGFIVVVSSRFGDIFRTNAGKAGLLAAAVDQAGVEFLWAAIEAVPGTRLTVDLESQQILVEGREHLAPVTFEVSEHTRYRLLNGLGEIALTLMHIDEIARFESNRSLLMPTVRSIGKARQVPVPKRPA